MLFIQEKIEAMQFPYYSMSEYTDYEISKGTKIDAQSGIKRHASLYLMA